ncbi:MAG: cupin domain-containing protein [Anaerolineaceae bacterium]
MASEDFFKNYQSSLTFPDDKYGKATLFFSEQILVGLNCFRPGQELDKHPHENQTRFYLVLEGEGQVTIGEEVKIVAAGDVVWVPPRHPHRIVNSGSGQLVMLVGITPSKCD